MNLSCGNVKFSSELLNQKTRDVSTNTAIFINNAKGKHVAWMEDPGISNMLPGKTGPGVNC